MKLIAESGSTRTEWALVEDNHLIQRVFTEGLNPFFQTRREISRSVRLGLPETFFKRKLEQVYYYGAGCTSYEKKNVLGASLVAQFKTPIQVESDLLAAARGLFKCEAGIACILGTGSNSCFYNGKIIVKNVRAGGYILGDEGSGAVLGKHFLSDVLKGLSSTGPEVTFNCACISLAMMFANVVLPSPGGPCSSTWSSESPRIRAAWMKIRRLSTIFSCPAKLSSSRGRI